VVVLAVPVAVGLDFLEQVLAQGQVIKVMPVGLASQLMLLVMLVVVAVVQEP
jgi:hypothetical protein